MVRPNGLRVEIILNLIVLLAAALVFGSVLQLKVSERELLQERVDLTKSLFEVGVRGFSGGRVELDGAALAQQLSGRLDVRQMLIVDANMAPVFSYSSREALPRADGELLEARHSLQPQARIDYDGAWWPAPADERQRIVITVPFEVPGADPLFLQADVSLADLRGRLFAAQRPVVLYMLLFGVVLVVFGSILIGRTIVAPIRRLMLATQNVAQGDLSRDVTASGLREVSDLADSFNVMTAALRDSREQTATHIEELRHANRELSETRDELVRSEKLASVGHLAAGVAHEIGNPLGALIGYLGLLEQDVHDPCRDLVKRAQGEAARIDRLVRELLDYASPAHMSSEPVDPLAATREALLILEQQQALAERELQVHLPGRLSLVRGSSAKLVQLLLNLMLNARDASSAHDVVELHAGEEEGEVVIRVRDEGSGIDGKDLPHIFDPFFTTKPQGEGRGLGLAVCHHIVIEMGGRIEVTSEKGRGTTFEVRLPRCEG